MLEKLEVGKPKTKAVFPLRIDVENTNLLITACRLHLCYVFLPAPNVSYVSDLYVPDLFMSIVTEELEVCTDYNGFTILDRKEFACKFAIHFSGLEGDEIVKSYEAGARKRINLLLATYGGLDRHLQGTVRTLDYE